MPPCHSKSGTAEPRETQKSRVRATSRRPVRILTNPRGPQRDTKSESERTKTNLYVPGASVGKPLCFARPAPLERKGFVDFGRNRPGVGRRGLTLLICGQELKPGWTHLPNRLPDRLTARTLDRPPDRTDQPPDRADRHANHPPGNHVMTTHLAHDARQGHQESRCIAGRRSNNRPTAQPTARQTARRTDTTTGPPDRANRPTDPDRRTD